MYANLSLGIQTYVLGGGFTPQGAVRFLADHRITHLLSAPTAYRALRAATEKARPEMFALRSASSAGEPLTPSVSDWFEAHFGPPIRNHYGQSEVAVMCMNHHAGPHARPQRDNQMQAVSMGLPMRGIEVAVLDQHGRQIAEEGLVGEFAIDAAASPLYYFSNYWGHLARVESWPSLA